MSAPFTTAPKYEAPRVERLGTLREMTLAGPGATTDTFGQNPTGAAGCKNNGRFQCGVS